MKVLNLQCAQHHGFEGWFASEDAFQDQLQRGLVECPFCADTQVTKLPSAPRLNLTSSGTPESKSAGPEHAVASVPDAQMQRAWLKMVRHVMAHTEDVGERFADEARRIHHGEVQERGIRGQATREETEALLDEGIAVLPLPVPKALKETLQ